MRKTTFVLASVLALSVPSLSAAQSEMVAGEVRRINEADGKITLRHGPIKSLNMDEPHTMVFRVQAPAMLKQVKVGDKVKFTAARVNGRLTVTSIQKGK